MTHNKDAEKYLPTEQALKQLRDAFDSAHRDWVIREVGTVNKSLYEAMLKHQETYGKFNGEAFNDVTTKTINLKPASNSSYTINVNEKRIFDTAKLTEEEKEALTKPKPGVIVFDDRLPSGEPCREDEVAGLGWLNLGRYDPMRKTAVFHDRLYDGIIAGTSEITQDEADKLYLKAMLAEADQHQLGYARAIFRYGIVRLVSFFRRVGK